MVEVQVEVWVLPKQDFSQPTAVIIPFPIPLQLKPMMDDWYCVRAGCINQDIPGPIACFGCSNWRAK